MTRLIPASKLTLHFSYDPIDFDLTEDELVIVRDKETGKRIEEERPDFENIRRRLAIINDVNSRYKITANVEDGFGIVETRIFRPIHYRVFHPGGMHGRIYTGKYGHQSLSKLERSTIRLDGEESVELDYSALHIRMLYHLAGKECKSDPYELWESATPELRTIAKQTINALINARDRKSAVAACNQAMNRRTEAGNYKTGKKLRKAISLHEAVKKTKLSFKQVAELALKIHPIIEENREKSDYTQGEKLMTLDGKIAQIVLEHFAKRSTPILGVHDSFIVPKHAQTELKEVMMQEYKKQTGYLPEIK